MSEPCTVSEWTRHAAQLLQRAGIESAKLEASVLLAHALKVERSWLLAYPEAQAPAEADALLQRRLKREPLAYILGRREFYGRTFRVTPDVLIPRHETEGLVEAVLERGRREGLKVLDLGTGSGAIAITIALERPDWAVTAVDLSPAALAVARENAEALAARVDFVRSDAFEALIGDAYDLIVSNPPYIDRDDQLPPEVRDHEPSLALFADENGLAFYRRLAEGAADHLNDGGCLLLELGAGQAEAVRATFEMRGWRQLETRRDLAGIERVIAFDHPWECATTPTSLTGD
jgi:release factor glutamine methyltransferase